MAITTFKLNKLNLIGREDVINLYTDNYLVLESNQSSNHADFCFIVEVYKYTLFKIAEWKLVPNYAGKLITNLTPVLKNHVIETPKFTNYSVETIRVETQQFRIKAYEYYNGSIQSSQTKDVYVYNTRPTSITDEKYYLNHNDLPITKPLLTKLSDGNVFTLNSLQIIGVSDKAEITVSLILANGSVVSNQVSVTNRMTMLNLQHFIAEYFTIQQIKNAKLIKITVDAEYGITQTLTYRYDYFTCDKYITLCFQNEFGVYETFNFNHSERSMDTEAQSYLRKEHLFDGSNYVKGGMQKSAARATEKLHLWTDLIDEDTANWLYKQLLTTKHVYIVEMDNENNYVYTPLYIEPANIRIESSEYSDGQVISLTAITQVYDNV